ncbi:MAG: hypothetical protein ACQCXQ_00390 [Verrucomicrobiales bacterium]|nr:hypothetical protein [Verrucomicrobiota bacterium JB025]
MAVALVALAAWFVPPVAFGARSVSQFGITWTFSADRPVGQFANGDWWVVGPVTITSITPATTNDTSGTMVNPSVGNANGWDTRIKYGTYSEALNIAKSLPVTLQGGNSVMSCVSFTDWASKDNPQMETMAILTVLSSSPATGSFRPPYIGSDKSLRWNVSQLNYNVLRKLAKPTTAPELSVVEGYFERPWIEKEDGWTGRYFHPHLNHPFQNRGAVGTYGREMAHTAADGLLSLQLDYTDAEKKTLLIRMVQAGIDIYGAARAGALWGDGGGHNQGRKMVMLLAGAVLGDAAILEYADAGKHKIFQEDLQTFYVSQADINRTHTGVNGAEVGEYTAADLNMPEWGTNHHHQPVYDNRLWTCPYRTVAGPCTLGHILTANLMGVQDLWNYPAAFDYYERFYGVEKGNVSTGTNSIQPFVADMWSLHWDGSGSESGSGGAVVVAGFNIGDKISLIKTTNVRVSGSLSAELLDTHQVGLTGTIIAGPVYADNITWWQVDYDGDTDGWSGGDNFQYSGGTPVEGGFSLGDQIRLIKVTNVRDGASLSSELLGTHAKYVPGIIVGGPIEADDIIWWRVDYFEFKDADTGDLSQNSLDGWSGEDNFEVPTAPSSPTKESLEFIE